LLTTESTEDTEVNSRLERPFSLGFSVLSVFSVVINSNKKPPPRRGGAGKAVAEKEIGG
jgi:hypothetical protein